MIQPGLKINNRYQVIRPLGSGGFGQTFILDDQGTQKVLKVLNLNNFQSNTEKQKAITLFQREADVLKKLNFPGIPKVEADGYFEFDLEDNKHYCLVMEEIEGQNLLDWLQKRKNISQEKAIEWLKQLLAILEQLHNHQYFHRDIKPENIMLKPNEQIVLIDFGSVREKSNTYLNKLRRNEEVTGLFTRGYAPLEQIKGEAVPQSDFYALGRTFVHLLTGIHPDKLPEEDDELNWRDSAENVDKHFADLIDDLMAFTPEARPKTVQEILQLLTNVELSYTGLVVPPTEIRVKNAAKNSWLHRLPFIGNHFIRKLIAVIAIGTIPLYFVKVPLQRQPLNLPANISLLNTIKGHSNFVHAVAFSPDSRILASGSKDNTVKLWDRRTGKELQTLSSGALSEIWAITISPSGRMLASGHWQDKTVKLWDLEKGQLLHTLKGHLGEVRAVAFSPNGKILASSSHDKTIKLWFADTGKLLHTFSGHTNHVTSIAFSSDGKTFASASDDKSIKLWNLDTLKLINTFNGHSAEVLSILFSPDGQTLVSGSADKTIRLWDLHTGQLQRTLRGHSSWVWCLAISPNGQTIASGSYDNFIKVWNLHTGENIRTLEGHTDRVYAIAFTPDGKSLASGGWDNTVRIWGERPLNAL